MMCTMSLGGPDTPADGERIEGDGAPAPLWGPPSGGRAVALWEPPVGESPPALPERPPDKPKDLTIHTGSDFARAGGNGSPAGGGDGAYGGSGDDGRDDRPLGDRPEPTRRRPTLVALALVGGLTVLLAAALTGWPGSDTPTDELAGRLIDGGVTPPTNADGEAVAIPPSQPATPVSFQPVTGEVVRPEPVRARVVDPRTGDVIMVALMPGTAVDSETGQVVVRTTGTPTTWRPITSSTTDNHATTTVRPTTTEEPTTTTEAPTTTEEPTTTTEAPTTTIEEPPTTVEVTVDLFAELGG